MGLRRVGCLLPVLLVACSRAALGFGDDPGPETQRDDGRAQLPDRMSMEDASLQGPSTQEDLCEPYPCAGMLATCDPSSGECVCPGACEAGDRCVDGEAAVCRGDADGCLDWADEVACEAGCFDAQRCGLRDTLQWGTAGTDLGLDFGLEPVPDLGMGGGGFYFTGHTERSFTPALNAGEGDVFLTRFFADGTEDWSRQWGSASHEQGNALSLDADGDGDGIPAVYVAGRTFGALGGQASEGDGDAFLTRFGLDGTHAWTRHLGTTEQDAARDVAVGAGAAYVVGTSEGNLGGQPNSGGLCAVGPCPDGVMCPTRPCTDAYVTRFEADGTRAWTRLFGTPQGDVAAAVTIAPDGGVLVAGHSGGDFDGVGNQGGPCAPRPCNDLFLTRFEPDGSRTWTQVWGSSDNDLSAAVTTDASGRIYVTGMSDGNRADGRSGLDDGILTKLSRDGLVEWTRQWGSDEDDDIEDVFITGGGDIVVVGQTHGNLDGRTDPPHHWDIFVTRFFGATADGGTPESTQWGSASLPDGFRPPSGANGGAQDADGNLVVFGYTLGDLDGNTNAGSDCANMLGCSDLFLATVAPR